VGAVSDDSVSRLEVLELDLVPQSGREGGQRPLAIEAGSVESTVYDTLDPRAKRLEEGRHDERRCRYRDRVAAREALEHGRKS
jgi:hypothetical protein